MKIIAILSGKGGTGKTTLSINIATGLARGGAKVAAIETDLQLSMANWQNPDKCLFDIVEATGERDVYQAARKLKGYDYVIIDGAATISAISAAAVMVADLVLIPLSPSPLDFSASGAILDVVEARQRLNPVPVRFVVTKRVNNATMTATLRDAMESTGIEPLSAGTSHRQAYIKSLLNGGTVYDSDDSTAKGEIDVIIRDIKELLQ